MPNPPPSARSRAPAPAARPASPKEGATRKPRATGAPGPDVPAAEAIDARIAGLGDWRGEALAKVRCLVHEADPEVVEERKWIKPTNPWGVAVWSHAGIVCTGEVYKETVKVTFAKGAALPDPQGVFNASLAGGTRRAVDIREGDKLDAVAFKALVRAAVEANVGGASTKTPRGAKAKAASRPPAPAAKAAKPKAERGAKTGIKRRSS